MLQRKEGLGTHEDQKRAFVFSIPRCRRDSIWNEGDIILASTYILHIKPEAGSIIGKTWIMRIYDSFESFNFGIFPPIFVLIKSTSLEILFDCKLQVFKNSPNETLLPFLIDFCKLKK